MKLISFYADCVARIELSLVTINLFSLSSFFFFPPEQVTNKGGRGMGKANRHGNVNIGGQFYLVLPGQGEGVRFNGIADR